MKDLYKLRDILKECVKDLDTLKSGHLKPAELESMNYITDTIKNIDKIEMLEENEGSYLGYSMDGDWTAEMRGRYGNERSYARDSKGRYSRDYSAENDYNDGTSERRRHYVRGHYSYAGAKHMVLEHLEDAMEAAETEREREAINKAIKSIEMS